MDSQPGRPWSQKASRGPSGRPPPPPRCGNVTIEGLWAGQRQAPARGPEGAWVSPRPRPRTHVPVHQHVEADAESLQQGAVLTAVVHLVVLGEPGGQRGKTQARCGLLSLLLEPSGSSRALQPSFKAQPCLTVGRDSRRRPPCVFSWPPAQPKPGGFVEEADFQARP